jgi:hemerythrin-like metal-binding protein
MTDQRKSSRRKSENIKRMVFMIIAVLGFILLNIRLGLILRSGPLPTLIIMMGLSIPVIVTFIVTLILVEKIKEVIVVSSFDFRGLPILIIEANIVNKEILSSLLEKTGIPIDFAENSQRAVSMFQENPGKYRLVFVDDQIQGVDELPKSIRSIKVEWASNVPIIAMIANAERENIEKCLAAGMTDYIEKPFDPDDICIMIKKRALFFNDKQKAKPELEQGIAWNEGFALGDDQVDAQHFQIFELVSALVSACADGLSTKMLKGILDFLLDYTVEHFESEEALMQRYGYTEFKKHKKLHEVITASVNDLARRFDRNGSSTDLSNELIKIVVSYLTTHDMVEDKKIVAHIRSVTVRT